MRPALVSLICLALSCGGEPRSQGHAPTASIEEADGDHLGTNTSTSAPEAPLAAEAPGSSANEEAPGEPRGVDPFEASLPSTPCPDSVAVAIAHQNGSELPTWLDGAIAFRSGDGRRVRIAVANHPLELDSAGRFAAPTDGQARFEMDATRTRRGPLVPRVLGAPDARNGGLSHARIVTSGPLLTFGVRNIGHVEITAIDEHRVCGRIELDDGFGRVRGAFTAPFVGPLPQ